ncbi:MAG: hypothetical protein DRJ26_04250, partial [Candidatus Methanomethylicota archaeon]
MNRNVIVLIVIGLISGTYWSLIYPVYQPFALSLGVSMSLLGMIEAIGGGMGLLSTLSQLLGGVLADKHGRKKVMIIASTISLLGFVIYLASSSLRQVSLLVLGSIVMGCSWMRLPARNALAAESSDREVRGLTFSLMMFAATVPGIVFSPLGGWLAEKFGYEVIFMISLAMEALCLTIIAIFIVEEKVERSKLSFKSTLHILIPKARILKNLYFIMAVDAFFWGLGSTLLYGFLSKSFKFSDTQLGILSGIFTASLALTEIPAGKIVDKYGAKISLILSELIGIITLALWLTAKDFTTFAISQIVFGASPSLWVPALNTYVSERAPEDKIAGVMGGLSAFRGLISFPAPYIGGLLFEISGFHLPIMINLIGAIISLVLLVACLE